MAPLDVRTCLGRQRTKKKKNTCVWCMSVCDIYVVGVLGQNGSGQNGSDKMVWTKWYTDKMVLDTMVRTKWYGQNGTDKTLPIESSIKKISTPLIDTMTFSSILLPL